MAHTKKGAVTTPAMLKSKSDQAKSVATWSIAFFVASSPFCALLAAQTGTKAWLKAPSAKRRRNKLGIRKATLNASVSALAPKAEAMSNSLTKPVMRDARVQRETVDADLRRLTKRV